MFWVSAAYAFRALGRHRAFAVAAFVSIALAVGANAAVFSLVNALWLRPLPVREPERIVIPYRPPVVNDGTLLDFHTILITERLETLDAFSAVTFELNTSGRMADWAPTVRLAAGGTPITAMPVAHDFFQTLGVAVRGRGFMPEEDRRGTAAVGIVSHNFWRTQLGGSPDAIGTRLETTRGSLLIVGVADRSFRAARLGAHTDLWIPLGVLAQFSDLAAGPLFERLLPLTVYARLQDGVSIDVAESQVRRALGGGATLRSLRSVAFQLRSEHDLERQSSLLRVLWVAALLVLLLGCANLAALLLARAESRRHELAVRLCIGATRRALARLILLEAGIVCAGGLLLGLIVSNWLLASLAALELPAGITVEALEARLDWRVTLFAGTVAVAATAIAALSALGHASRADLSVLLASAATTGTRLTLRARQGLLAAHVAFSVALLCGASTLLWSVHQALDADLGFAQAELLFVSLRPRLTQYTSQNADDRRWNDYAGLLERIGRLPAVRATSYGDPIFGALEDPPLTSVTTLGSGHQLALSAYRVGPQYLSAVGARFVDGRDLVVADERRAVSPLDVLRARADAIQSGSPYKSPNRTPTAVVDTTLARTLWPGERAVGKTLVRGRTGIRYEVVGLVESIRHDSGGPESPSLFEFQPLREDDGSRGFHFAIRTHGPAAHARPAVLAVVRQVFSDPAHLRMSTAEAIVAETHAQELMGARVYSWFGVASAVLALAGIYGLITFLVLRQRREIGLRLALGASAPNLATMLILRVLKPVAAGVVAGLGMAIWLTRLLSTILVDIGAPHLPAYLLAALTFLLIALGVSLAGVSSFRRITTTELLRAE
jgi:predicted permease